MAATAKKFIVPMSNEAFDELAILYIRVSTTEQALEGYSVDEQIARLKNYCQAFGIKIYKVVVDPGYSGSSLDRPGIQEVIRDVRAKRAQKVIVWKLDRLSRSQKDTLIMLEDVFLENDCDFVSMMESFDTSTPFGRAIVGILAAFAQLERENIRERTTMGRVARIAKGYYSGSHAPLGYHFKPGCNDLIVDDYEAVIVREIFSSFLAGKSINGIGAAMAEKYGSVRKFNGTMIRRILRNSVYIGKVRVNDVLYDGVHEPLISETDFYMVAAVMEYNQQIYKQCERSESLLTGLIWCGDCGARMHPKRITSGYPLRRYVCYSVSRTRKSMIRKENCSNRLHPYTQEELEDIIKGEVIKLAVDDAYLREIITEDTGPGPIDEAELFEERLAEVSKQMKKLIDLYQIGAVELSDIQVNLGELKREKETLQNNIYAAKENPTPQSDVIRSYAHSFKEAVEKGDDETVRQIVRMLINKVIVLNEDIEIQWSFC